MRIGHVQSERLFLQAARAKVSIWTSAEGGTKRWTRSCGTTGEKRLIQSCCVTSDGSSLWNLAADSIRFLWRRRRRFGKRTSAGRGSVDAGIASQEPRNEAFNSLSLSLSLSLAISLLPTCCLSPSFPSLSLFAVSLCKLSVSARLFSRWSWPASPHRGAARPDEAEGDEADRKSVV